MLVNRNDREDFVKVLDFGISKDLDLAVGAALTRPDVAIGTPAYMAPEQAAGKAADALTDVYAVGGLLYEMLTGTPPCSGDDAIEVLQRKATEDRGRSASCAPSCRATCRSWSCARWPAPPATGSWSMTALKEQVLACLAALEGAPTRGPSGALTTPRLPLGSADTAIAHRRDPRTAARGASPARPPGAARPLSSGCCSPGPRWSGVRLPAGRGPPRRGAERGARGRRGRDAAAAPAAPPAPPPLPIALAPAPPPSPPVSPAMDDEPRKALAAEARHAVAPEPAAAVLHTPAAHHTSPAAGGELRTGKTTSGLPRRRPRPARRHDDDPEPRTVGLRLRRLPGGDPPGRQAIAAGAEISGRLLVGDVYFHLERYREALREYNAAVARDPTDTSAHRRRDLAREKAGQAAQGDAP